MKLAKIRKRRGRPRTSCKSQLLHDLSPASRQYCTNTQPKQKKPRKNAVLDLYIKNRIKISLFLLNIFSFLNYYSYCSLYISNFFSFCFFSKFIENLSIKIILILPFFL